MQIAMIGKMNIDGDEREGVFIEATQEECVCLQHRCNLFTLPECMILFGQPGEKGLRNGRITKLAKNTANGIFQTGVKYDVDAIAEEI